MTTDDLFTRTTSICADVLKPAGRIWAGDYANLASFNKACIDFSYDMMICFVFNSGTLFSSNSRFELANHFDNYLDTVCPGHSPEYTYHKKAKYDVVYSTYLVWWIHHPEKFEDLLQLAYCIYKFDRQYSGVTKHTDVTGYIVTSENHNEIENLRTFVFPLGYIFDIPKGARNVNDAIISNLNERFTLFWNNLNQQVQMFYNNFYGREIDSVDSFVRVFSRFAAKRYLILVKQRGWQANNLTRSYYENFISEHLIELFKK